MFLKVHEHEGVDGHDVYHEVLGRHKDGDDEGIELTQLLWIHVISRDHHMEMIHTVRRVEQAVTDSEIDHEPLALRPLKESTVTLTSER